MDRVGAGDGERPDRSIGSAADLSLLLARIGDGDDHAFEELYRCTSAKLLGICARILPSRQEAEEVLQETYIAVWRGAASFDRTRGSALAWLIALARHRAIDRLRPYRPGAIEPMAVAELVADPRPIASEALEAAGEQHRAVASLADLDPADAGLLRAAFLEGTSYPDLAERSGLPLGTIKSRVRRALLKLRAHLA